ncbi:SNF1-related protein kinase regulatory subunit beta-1 [Tripterygium wilfordii]|uniref:SNF1-related protein kinase regulatory subunit beta-1 n=1 Tax=Tripterygium wilfordii TaxID=458696 RepID=A0A7J7DF48_TRIWF|nr:SNF1-related protein kinase regulatory subunit beta-1-like [Tripterygium wilfordii]KAF5744980.1 SNF1-related protein kinase regulatory subunit beta-1 [Tripterygium wilfordii]
MGNASGREERANAPIGGSNGEAGDQHRYAPDFQAPGRVPSSDSMGNTPPGSPGRNHHPLLFAPQVPVAPLQRGDGHPFSNQISQNESSGVDHLPTEGIPTIITWNHGGNEVAIEGSWDNWTSRKILQRSGKDHSIILILPEGIYHYKFVVDGQWRYIPDVPFVADEMGHVCNLLDVNAYLPEYLDSVAEFEAPPSPDSSYSQALPTNEDFAKEPLAVPPQLHLTVLGMESSNEASSLKPRHVVLNHLFIEKGGASPSIVALGMTHRFQSKYVTVVVFKPLKR